MKPCSIRRLTNFIQRLQRLKTKNKASKRRTKQGKRWKVLHGTASERQNTLTVRKKPHRTKSCTLKRSRRKKRKSRRRMKNACGKSVAEKSALKEIPSKTADKEKNTKRQSEPSRLQSRQKTAQNAERAASRLCGVWRHKAVFGVILAIVLLIAWLEYGSFLLLRYRYNRI